MSACPHKQREEFEKWVTAMEPAYADENSERLTGGRGNYKVHNVACWWMGWQAAWNAALEEAAKALRENRCDCGHAEHPEHYKYGTECGHAMNCEGYESADLVESLKENS